MVRQLLLCAGVALGFSAFATDFQKAENVTSVSQSDVVKNASVFNAKRVMKNDGSVSRPKGVAANLNVQWKRPAGQFWGIGYAPEMKSWYYFTPLVLRPWVDYTFENISKNAGTPSWDIANLNKEQTGYDVVTSNDVNATASYIWGETPAAPLLKYSNIAYPLMYDGDAIAKGSDGKERSINVCPGENIEQIFGAGMPVSSHYYSVFSRHGVEKGSNGLISYSGAKGYEGMDDPEQGGWWVGTNSQGFNAVATRFEKPDQPYLLKSVQWMYVQWSEIPNNIPLKAYVFKTVDDAKIVTGTTSSGEEITKETLELGELIAESESFVPASTETSGNGFVEFKFVKKNPVTGATSNIDLEINDDITVVVTGFNADLGNGGAISSPFSLDEFDEGYGNLGFLGQLEEGADGNIQYNLTPLKDFFNSPLPNTVAGVLADVSYPWIHAYMVDQPSEVKLANDGETTETTQGLQYDLVLMSTSMTEDYEITYDGADECEWLSVVDVYDEMDEEDVYTGRNVLEFEATPNPNDESRVCHVKISIPAATYEITFLQGTNAEDPGAVEVVTANGKVQYYDLTGRRVVNPEKGVYVKVTGNKSEKVVF